MLDRFSWRSYDLRSILPVGWQSEILETARDAVSNTKKLEEEMELVHTLASIVDLQHDISLSQFQELVRVYLEITEPEFKQVKEGVVAEVTDRLQRLAQQKTSDETRNRRLL